ncbi:hypothetical protein JQX09_17750 [Sulfitobacter pseudonitzschiae]|uniref:Uncharacterized protein n=1 Tax=Pseudosulfitobacter pseudonitzschiae TaxID=1402135 RepID=A0A9Q2NKK8_9RHOB|nr:hypothetical protein [Pseudosulfitobacter pseudonitzschiae]MBM2293775.1 hypothetical protein [Pseudosulfitobacter pseudonitzschiae]MBM2298693.1 hypothetical protein [Pseudosulfitobacter pseudonitzschiae]MBM2303607.1 hypothetical protein [Pseudosulfitobacter pseudonitzschiae]MBM2313390.1 hypothetical protein [Pseudosulfitobacter pseudonitzschiae]MBM2318303.1 hypothetical protein [Pseudosulfitobacter pseudonitzschiae]
MSNIPAPKRFNAAPFTCEIQVTLHQPTADIYDNAAKLGRHWGRDPDWMPSNLNEAVAEIIMLSDAPLDLGVEIGGQ